MHRTGSQYSGAPSLLARAAAHLQVISDSFEPSFVVPTPCASEAGVASFLRSDYSSTGVLGGEGYISFAIYSPHIFASTVHSSTITDVSTSNALHDMKGLPLA